MTSFLYDNLTIILLNNDNNTINMNQRLGLSIFNFITLVNINYTV